MEYVNFEIPPYPYFVLAGTALYRPGDVHSRRHDIGVFDLIYIVYGELYITEENKMFHLKQHDLLILKPDAAHFGHKKNTEKTKFIWLHFGSSGEYYYTQEFQLKKKDHKHVNVYKVTRETLTLPLHKKLSSLESSEIYTILSKLVSTNIDKYQQKQTQGQEMLSPVERQELFCRLLNIIQVYQPQQNSSGLLAANIMQYISINYHTPLTLEKIAHYFNFHPVHIIRCLKKEFGITPNKAIIQFRIENAKKLLVISDQPIAKISEQLSFSSPSYFNKVFKEHTGMTPNEYRKQNMHDAARRPVNN